MQSHLFHTVGRDGVPIPSGSFTLTRSPLFPWVPRPPPGHGDPVAALCLVKEVQGRPIWVGRPLPRSFEGRVGFRDDPRGSSFQVPESGSPGCDLTRLTRGKVASWSLDLNVPPGLINIRLFSHVLRKDQRSGLRKETFVPLRRTFRTWSPRWSRIRTDSGSGLCPRRWDPYRLERQLRSVGVEVRRSSRGGPPSEGVSSLPRPQGTGSPYSRQTAVPVTVLDWKSLARGVHLCSCTWGTEE